jgi:hypothetical protein
MWVRVPPAVPLRDATVECIASPQDSAKCVDVRILGPSYPYLLGLYLGDGMLSRGRRNVWRLRISLDVKYPGIIERAKAAISEVANRRPGGVARLGCIEVYSYWKHWNCLFPQHGPGPKHERDVSLAPWQWRLVSRYPDEFLAGLIHSDGCRVTNRVKGPTREYEYPRYFFSNRSPAIRAMFVSACALVAVECRRDGTQVLSVARGDSVAILDRLIGPKR